jgi:alpha-beta hydrolase superfamily lysophospholipase
MDSLVPRIDFYTAADGRRLAARVWERSEEGGARSERVPLDPRSSILTPRVRVVFLHGIISHSGWYSRSCRHLANAGFEVHFLDRRGSGLNPQDCGDVDRYETWLSDVEVYLEHICREHGVGSTANSLPSALCPLPVLCGISWGAKVAVAVARRRPDLLQGLALICPGIYAYQQPGLLKRALLSLPLPPRMLRRRVKIPLADPYLFTDTPPWVSYVAEDPLSIREITLRFAREDLKLTRLARESTSFTTLDLLLVLSGRDRIVDNRQTRAYFDRVTGRSKRLIEYAGAAHTLEFEDDPQPYLDDLTEWIQAVSR